MKAFRLIVLAALFCCGCTQLNGGGSSATASRGIEFYFNDTEGGASTLFITPAGESVLIDTGNPGDRDPGRIMEAIKDAGLTKIDYLIITHYHVDHFGGAPKLATMIPIGTLYDNADDNPSRDKPSPEYLAMKVGKRVEINPGDVIPLKQAAGSPPIKLVCVAARKKFIDPPLSNSPNPFISMAKGKALDLSDNANSIVTVLSFGGWRFYDGGDLTWNIENDLMNPINRVGTVDVYQVTHHGLAQSNNPVLVQALEPTVAIMNNGPNKGCEPETFATLKGTPSIKDIWQQHKNLRPDGNVNNTTPELIANMDRDCKGNSIHMSVAGDAMHYTVSIPATGVSKTYATRAHR